MAQYDFSTQKKLFNIANKILIDYDIQDWSFGGGTALSALYYQHRISYDIDIFSDDYSAINRLFENREEIAENLGIVMEYVEASSTAITFILNAENTGLKLDFVFSPALTAEPYEIKNVFGYPDIKVQTPMEIIAKKMAYREKATIRDFVDYALAEKQDQLLTKLKSESIENIDIDRYLDIVDKFNNFDTTVFNDELENLLPNEKITKEDLSPIINNVMKPNEYIEIALDSTGEVVAFDEFIESYRSIYEEIGTYFVYTIKSKGKSYKEVLKLSTEVVLELIKEEGTNILLLPSLTK